MCWQLVPSLLSPKLSSKTPGKFHKIFLNWAKVIPFSKNQKKTRNQQTQNQNDLVILRLSAMDDDHDRAETPPPPPPEPVESVRESKGIQEEKYLRDRPMEASKRAAPGDTLKELSAILQALGDESPRGGPAVAAPDAESHPEETETAPPPPPEDGRGRGGRSCASRRAAPGDTLREDPGISGSRSCVLTQSALVARALQGERSSPSTRTMARMTSSFKRS
eukprot:symbB.v1.2.033590.t1/scaffold4198.1/size43174/3